MLRKGLVKAPAETEKPKKGLKYEDELIEVKSFSSRNRTPKDELEDGDSQTNSPADEDEPFNDWSLVKRKGGETLESIQCSSLQSATKKLLRKELAVLEAEATIQN